MLQVRRQCMQCPPSPVQGVNYKPHPAQSSHASFRENLLSRSGASGVNSKVNRPPRLVKSESEDPRCWRCRSSMGSGDNSPKAAVAPRSACSIVGARGDRNPQGAASRTYCKRSALAGRNVAPEDVMTRLQSPTNNERYERYIYIYIQYIFGIELSGSGTKVRHEFKRLPLSSIYELRSSIYDRRSTGESPSAHGCPPKLRSSDRFALHTYATRDAPWHEAACCPPLHLLLSVRTFTRMTARPIPSISACLGDARILSAAHI